MKSFLAFVSVFGVASLAAAQDLSKPLPSVVHSALPATAPTPLMSHPTDWNADCATAPSCAARPHGSMAPRGSCCTQLWNWMTFRVCAPNHSPCVLFDYHAPLRTYFPHTPAPIGAGGPLDCEANRHRAIGWEPSRCATPSCAVPSYPIARPTPTCATPSCGTERKSLCNRLLGVFGLDSCGSGPAGCQPEGMHYATNKSSAVFHGLLPATTTVPAAALLPATGTVVNVNRPFTNP